MFSLLFNLKTQLKMLYMFQRALLGQKAILAMRSIAAVSWCWRVRGPLTLPNIIIQPGKWPQAVQIFHIIISTGVPYNHFHKSEEAHEQENLTLMTSMEPFCRPSSVVCRQVRMKTMGMLSQYSILQPKLTAPIKRSSIKST